MNKKGDSGSSGSGSDSSSSESSLSESEAAARVVQKSKTTTARHISKLVLENDDSGSDNETGQLRLEDSEDDGEKAVKKSKQLGLSDDEEETPSEKKAARRKNQREEKENAKKATVGRKTARNVLAMIVSDNEEDVNMISGIIFFFYLTLKKKPQGFRVFSDPQICVYLIKHANKCRKRKSTLGKSSIVNLIVQESTLISINISKFLANSCLMCHTRNIFSLP